MMFFLKDFYLYTLKNLYLFIIKFIFSTVNNKLAE